MTESQSSKPVIILSHGAWHVSTHYVPLKEELERRGFTVVNDSHPTNNGAIPPTSQAQDDFDQLRATTLSHLTAGQDVVVVMHSWGGVVGTHALLGLGRDEIESHPSNPSGRIIGLVYMSSWVPRFQVPTDNLEAIPPLPWLNFDPSKGAAFLIPEGVKDALYHDLTADQQEWALSHAVPFPMSAFPFLQSTTAPQTPPYTTIPTTYIVCDDDRGLPQFAQEGIIARVKAEVDVDFRQVHLKASHSAFISMPGAVAEIIQGSY